MLFIHDTFTILHISERYKIDRKTDGREKMGRMKKRKRDKMDGRGEPKRRKQKEHDSQNSDRVENH